MDQQIFVYVDLAGVTHLVGRLWLHNRKRALATRSGIASTI